MNEWLMVIFVSSYNSGYSAPAQFPMANKAACENALKTLPSMSLCVNQITGEVLKHIPVGPFTGPNPNTYIGSQDYDNRDKK